MEENSSRRRAVAAALLVGGLALLAGLAFLRRPGAAGRGADASAFERALREALSGVSSPNPLGKQAGSEAIGSLLQGLPGGRPGGESSGGASGAAGPAAPAGQGEGGDAALGAGASGSSGEGLDALRRHVRGASGLPGSSASTGQGEGGDAALGAAAAGTSSGGASRPKAEDVAQIFKDFISKLHKEAAAQGKAARGGPSGSHTVDAAYGQPQASSFGGVPNGEDSPLMASPSYRNLMKVGKDGAFGVQLQQKGMSDGAKDKAGKEFDGNLKTLAPIPIMRTKGTFNQEAIQAQGQQGSGSGQ